MMYKIIGGDQKQYGPVTSEEMRRWISEGRLNSQSLTQQEGTNEWKPLGSFTEFADVLGAPSPASVPLVSPTDSQAWAAQILARSPRVQIGACVASSWNLLVANFGLLFGATFFVWVLAVVCQFIPLVGGPAYYLLKGVLYGGLYLVFLKRIRGQPASVADVFQGFSSTFVQLMLAGFLTTLLSTLATFCCLFLPGIYLAIAWIFSVPLVADQRLEFWSAMELSRKVVTRVWFEILGLVLLVFLPLILVQIFVEIKISSAIFPIVQDVISGGPQDLHRLTDIVRQVAKASIPLTLLIKIVLFLNLPFAAGALMYAYEDLFGTRAAPTA